MNQFKVISIDPGVTTGFCYARIIPSERVDFFPFQRMEDVDIFWDHLAEYKPDIIVMEDFEFRQNARKTGLNLFPKELIGVAKLYSLKAPTPVGLYMQKAATGKAYYSDKILISNNWYKRGVPHGMDATRHFLQWLTFMAGFKYRPKLDKDIHLLEDWSLIETGMI